MNRRRPDPLTIQAQTEAEMRYGQALTDLLSARHTAYHQFGSDVSTAEQTARALQRASRQAIPQLAAIYSEADRTRKDAVRQIKLADAAPAGSNSALAIALRGEAGLASQRMAGEKARAQVETVNRGLDAVAGLAYTKRNLLQDYRGTRADLMSQTRGVHSQMGAFTQSRVGELQSAQGQADFDAQKFAETQRHNLATEDISRGVDPVTGKALPGKGPRGRTPSEQRQVAKDTADAHDEIALARTWIQRMRTGTNPLPFPMIADRLKTGGTTPHAEKYRGVDAKGKPVDKVRYIEIPYPAIKSDFLRAAIELEAKGYLSPTSIHNLRSVRNVHVPKEWMPVKVKFHYRRPKSTGGGYADIQLPAGSR